MKICYVLSHFYPYVGGAEKAMMDYILSVKKLYNTNVRVVTCSVDGFVGKKEYEGIEIYYYDWRLLFGHPLVKSKDIEEHVKWSDLVHTAVYSPVHTTSKVCQKLNKPLIVTVYESLNEKWFWVEKNPIKALLFRVYERYVVSAKCDFYHTISNATTNDLNKNVKHSNIRQIYNIVEINKDNVKSNRKKFNKFFGIDSNDKVFLSYGRPGKTKGMFIYLDAIKNVVENTSKKKLKNIKFCFIMANNPIDQKQKFIRLVNEWHLEQYVIVRDSVSRSDLDTYIKSCDYVVVPSITEGFGLTAVEACEMGKDIIHSNAGSLSEVTFGNVIEFENRNPLSLSKALRSVISGKNEFVKKEKKDFSSKTIGIQMYDLYMEALKIKK